LLKAELQDGIDLDQWSNGETARNEDRTRCVPHLADRQRGPLRAGRASGPGLNLQSTAGATRDEPSMGGKYERVDRSRRHPPDPHRCRCPRRSFPAVKSQ